MATWIPESASRRPPAASRAFGWAGIASTVAREPVALAGLAMVVTYVAVAVTVSFLPLRDPLQISTQRLAAPTGEFPLGTDALGRDLLSRILYGARLSIQVSVVSVAVATFVGGVLGLISGYLGGVADLVIGRVLDVFFAFPAILLALGIVAALGPDPRNVIIAIAVVYTPIFARVVRAPVLALKARDFVDAARAIGARGSRIVVRHIVPNLLSTLVVQVSLALSWSVLTEGALSFLGLSAQPPAPSWGVMLNEGRQYLEFATHLALFPGLAIMIAVLGFNLLGDGLRDALDPQRRS
jgi:peptide/nickel transport system permease protein